MFGRYFKNKTQSIRLMEKRFEKVFESAYDAIWLLEGEIIVDCNNKCLELFDVKRENIIGKSVLDFTPQFQPDGTESRPKSRFYINQMYKQGSIKFEWVHKKFNNEEFLAESSLSFFRFSDKSYITAFIRDISELRKEQDELHEYRLYLEEIVKDKTSQLAEKVKQLHFAYKELDTANEELISINEELHTANEDLDQTNRNLTQEIENHNRTAKDKAFAEEKLKQFVEQSSNGFIIINRQGIIEEWNESMYKFLGIPDSEAKNRYIWDIVSEMIVFDGSKEKLREMLIDNSLEFYSKVENGDLSSVIFEYQMKHKDSRIRYFQVTIFPIISEGGTSAGCMLNDITQKKKTEEELEKYRENLEILLAQKSEHLVQLSDRFSEVYNNSSDAITFIDILEDGKALKVFDMNPSAMELFKISQEMITRGIYVNDLINEENFKTFTTKLLPSILDGKTISYNEEIETSNGYWISTVYPIKNENGKVIRMASFSKNVTAEYEKDRLSLILSTVFESWPYEFWISDTEDRFIMQNENSKKMWGEIVGRKFEDMDFPQDLKEYSLQIHEKVLKGGRSTTEYKINTPEGTKNVLVNLNPINQDEKIIGYVGFGMDITELKRNEEKIKASEEKYRLLAENIDDVIFKYDINSGKYTYISPSVLKLRGFTPEEAMEQSMEDVIVPECFQKIGKSMAERIQKVHEGDLNYRSQNEEIQIYHKDGKPIWVEMASTLLTDQSGNVSEMISVSRDITQRKQAEFALKKSEAILKATLESISDGILVISADMKITHINTCFKQIFSVPDELIINHDDGPLLNYVTKQISDSDEFYKKVLEIYQTNEITEDILQFKDGRVIERHSYPLIEDSPLKGRVWTFRDISEKIKSEEALKKSEKLLSDSQRIAHIGSWEVDLAENKVTWNEEAYNIFGYDYMEIQPTIEILKEMAHPDDRAYFSSVDEEMMRTNIFKDYECRVISKDGLTRTILIVGSFAFDENGKPSRIFGIVQDITEQKRTRDLIIENERKFRSIFDNSKDGIVLLDNEFKIIDLNRTLLIKSSYTKEEIVDKRVIDFILKDEMATISRWLNQLREQKEIKNIESNLNIEKNSALPVEISATPIILNNNENYLLIVRDISERKRMENELMNIVINTEEKERMNFSQELHDGLGPLLSAAKMYVEWLEKPNANIQTNDVIPEIKNLLIEAGNAVREISFKLSPHILQNYGLIEALKAFTSKVKESAEIDIEIHVSELKSFSETVSTIIYRVLCECINNTIKHAKAHHIIIKFSTDESGIVINYSDDGRGFNVEKILQTKKGVGILNIQNRLKSINGLFTIQSYEGKGTSIRIKVRY